MEINCLTLFESLENYAGIVGKALLVLVPTWSNASDEEKQEIFDFYEGKVPREMTLAIKSGDIRIIEYGDFEAAHLDATSYFPGTTEIEETNSLYKIECHIIDEHGRLCWTNNF